jgi:hypothetical protein
MPFSERSIDVPICLGRSDVVGGVEDVHVRTAKRSSAQRNAEEPPDEQADDPGGAGSSTMSAKPRLARWRDRRRRAGGGDHTSGCARGACRRHGGDGGGGVTVGQDAIDEAEIAPARSFSRRIVGVARGSPGAGRGGAEIAIEVAQPGSGLCERATIVFTWQPITPVAAGRLALSGRCRRTGDSRPRSD